MIDKIKALRLVRKLCVKTLDNTITWEPEFKSFIYQIDDKWQIEVDHNEMVLTRMKDDKPNKADYVFHINVDPDEIGKLYNVIIGKMGIDDILDEIMEID